MIDMSGYVSMIDELLDINCVVIWCSDALQCGMIWCRVILIMSTMQYAMQ
jgi:hypothetical protein